MRLQPCCVCGLGAWLGGTCRPKVSEGEPGTFLQENKGLLSNLWHKTSGSVQLTPQFEVVFKQKDIVTAVPCSPLWWHQLPRTHHPRDSDSADFIFTCALNAIVLKHPRWSETFEESPFLGFFSTWVFKQSIQQGIPQARWYLHRNNPELPLLQYCATVLSGQVSR